MTHHAVVEEYLAAISRRLDLPAGRAAEVLSELRTHLLADAADRMAAGEDEEAAARDAVAEMGDPTQVALELARENRPRRTTLRAILAAQIMLLGLPGVGFGVSHFSKVALAPLAAATGAMRPIVGRTGPGVRLSGWYEPSSQAWDWLWSHPVAMLLLAFAAMAPLMFVVGYVARQRGWLFGLIPWALLALLELKAASRPSFGTWAADVPGGLFIALVLIGGAHLGTKFYQSRFRRRGAVVAVIAALLAPVAIVGLVSITRSLADVVMMAAHCGVAAVLTWLSLTAAGFVRRHRAVAGA